MLEKVFYTSVLVTDQDRALDFYTNVVGLEKRVENPTPDGPRFLTVGVEGDDFQLVLWPGTPGQAQPTMGRPPASITIETDDIRKTFEELKSRGVEFASDVLEFPWGYVAQFQDPTATGYRYERAASPPHSMSASDAAISVVPANEASWEDLQTVFGTRGQGARCQCQRYKLRPRESFAGFPVEERAFRLREQTDCGHPESETTSGLIAYLDRDPVGWCAVEARTAYEGLVRNSRVPWAGRAEDKTDDSVWAVTCLFTRAGFRRRGVSRALARSAVEFARERGARAIEAYPMTTKHAISEELHVGTESVFADAGLTEVSRPTLRRVVMRLDF